ncbi:MAG: hypothetical protein M1537_06485 [Nitrospirae bacterium]|nr:hypothetical protein [Nitrospirota bacterium]MCL5285628.1 hypothetical protein [Nitrospirota bacterium]
MKNPLRTLSMPRTRSLIVPGMVAVSLLAAAAGLSGTDVGGAMAKTTRTKVLFVTQDGAREKTLDLELGESTRLHYNHFWMDVTRNKPFVDPKGRKVIVPNTPTFRGIHEITLRFWHPRGEPNLLDAIVVKAYDSHGRLIKHGAFDRGVFVLLLSNSLFKGNYVRFDGIGHYVRGDKSLYVKVLVRKTRQVAIIPFADFINDFTRQINTQPVVSWAAKRP